LNYNVRPAKYTGAECFVHFSQLLQKLFLPHSEYMVRSSQIATIIVVEAMTAATVAASEAVTDCFHAACNHIHNIIVNIYNLYGFY